MRRNNQRRKRKTRRDESGIELAQNFYQVFHNILWKNLNKFFGQPNTVEERHESFARIFFFNF